MKMEYLFKIKEWGKSLKVINTSGSNKFNRELCLGGND